MLLDINIVFESNGNIIEIGKGKSYRLLNIEGIETVDNELVSTNNIFSDGSKVNNRRIKSKPIMIEGEFVGENKVRERQKLISFFNIHNEGKLIVKVNDVERSINYDIEGFKSKLDNVNLPLKFLVSLYCPNPFFEDIDETRKDVSTEIGNFQFPLHIPPEGLELSIRIINFITNVFNEGDVSAPIKVSLRAVGTVTNPTITNLNTGEYIMVKRTLSKGDTLEINTEFGNKRVEIIKENGIRENVFNYIDYKSRFFSIDSGDTRLKYAADVGDNNLDVYIYYTPRYLGV